MPNAMQMRGRDLVCAIVKRQLRITREQRASGEGTAGEERDYPRGPAERGYDPADSAGAGAASRRRGSARRRSWRGANIPSPAVPALVQVGRAGGLDPGLVRQVLAEQVEIRKGRPQTKSTSARSQQVHAMIFSSSERFAVSRQDREARALAAACLRHLIQFRLDMLEFAREQPRNRRSRVRSLGRRGAAGRALRIA